MKELLSALQAIKSVKKICTCLHRAQNIYNIFTSDSAAHQAQASNSEEEQSCLQSILPWVSCQLVVFEKDDRKCKHL